MTAVVRNLFRTTTVDAPTSNAEPVDYCQCGRGPVIGVVYAYDTRLKFMSLEDSHCTHHEAAYLRCVDCVADAALNVANGVIRERMREIGRQRDEQWAALQRQNEMRKAAGLPIVQTAIIPEGNEWPTGGQR
jgi:hypothetical protein